MGEGCFVCEGLKWFLCASDVSTCVPVPVVDPFLTGPQTRTTDGGPGSVG